MTDKFGHDPAELERELRHSFLAGEHSDDHERLDQRRVPRST